MLRLLFANTSGGRPRALEGLPGLCVEGPELKNLSSHQAIARHADHDWAVDGQHYFRVDITGPVRVRFQGNGRESRFFGPFQHFSCADGIAYVDHLFFASYSQAANIWHCIELKEDWPGFIVVPA
jgi:hypothetical protein